MHDPLEIELKLEFDPLDKTRLEQAALFVGHDGASDRLVSAYFDTPDLDLRTAGYSLRVRRKGQRRIQTVKADSGAAAGLFVRPEWEREIAGELPVIDAASGPLAQIIGRRTLDRIGRLFTTDVIRTVRGLSLDGAVIELALDEGEVRAGELREPLCEIELELGHGSPQVLFDVARRLNEEIPLRLGVRTKSERGYGLLGEGLGNSVKAEPVLLDREGDAREAFAAIARACMRHFRLNEAQVIAHGGAGSIHQARVALRRLRSAFSLFKPLLEGDPRVPLLREELRWLAAELGHVRNIDVLMDRVDDLHVQSQLATARERTFAHALTELMSGRTRLLMIDLAEWLTIGAWRTDPADPELASQNAAMFAADVLDKRRRRIKHRGHKLASLDDEHRHEVRIEAKKLRYATEFFVSLYPGKKAQRRHNAFLGALEEMQDHLGALNDIATGPEVFAALGIEAELPAIDKRKRGKLLEQAEDAHEVLIDAKRFWR